MTQVPLTETLRAILTLMGPLHLLPLQLQVSPVQAEFLLRRHANRHALFNFVHIKLRTILNSATYPIVKLNQINLFPNLSRAAGVLLRPGEEQVLSLVAWTQQLQPSNQRAAAGEGDGEAKIQAAH